MSITRLE